MSSGSPPRTRGIPAVGHPSPGSVRFTPACAGNPNTDDLSSSIHPVHPRACGESSARHYRAGIDARFTPAHAGNPCRRFGSAGGTPVHPRACGESSICNSVRTGSSGSPPRMRGIPVDDGYHRVDHRFTPAHAGNPSARASTARIASVHPRACGESFGYAVKVSGNFGSPPRMRGILFPLSAGKTDLYAALPRPPDLPLSTVVHAHPISSMAPVAVSRPISRAFVLSALACSLRLSRI